MRKETQKLACMGEQICTLLLEIFKKEKSNLFFSNFGFLPLQKMKEVNLDEWKNIRGPRPWEDSRNYQEQQRSRQQGRQSWGSGRSLWLLGELALSLVSVGPGAWRPAAPSIRTLHLPLHLLVADCPSLRPKTTRRRRLCSLHRFTFLSDS